MNGTVLLVK